jgi:putative Mg2+ transporter-C (MgtC) family protein
MKPLLPFEMLFASETVLRLLLAAFLGMVVGLERASQRKPAGIRTIMLISLASALFTVLSEAIGRMYNGDPTRIAAQLVTGIGFLGAGAILHARGSVVGLTTAATIFVMASIGMASGAGLYWIAIFSTLVVLFGLVILRWFEKRLKFLTRATVFTISTPQLAETMAEVSQALRDEALPMQQVQCSTAEGVSQLAFTVDVSDDVEKRLLQRFSKIKSATGVALSEGVASESS